MFLSASLFSLIFFVFENTFINQIIFLHLLFSKALRKHFLAMFQPFLVRFLTWVFNSNSKWLKYVKIKVFFILTL